MVTIAHLVEKKIAQRPFLQEALAREILNYGAVAEMLQPEITQELKQEVKISAIMMALRRLSEKLEEKFTPAFAFQEELDLTLKSNLAGITLIKTPETMEYSKKFYKILDLGEEMLTITQGTTEITFICPKRYFSQIKTGLEKELSQKIKNYRENLASLTIKIPPAAINQAGVYALILRTLAWEDLNVVEIVSTYSELTLIFAGEDVTRAYRCLHNLGK